MEVTLIINFEFRKHSGFLSKLFATILMAAALAVISGCAGTATGRDTSVYSSLKAEEVSNQKSSEASAMVVIRYPAMIHTNAENLYVSSFTINAIGGEVPYGVHGNRQTSRVAQSIIEKSSYFAMSLYNELKSVLPEGSVLFRSMVGGARSPHYAELPDEQLTSRVQSDLRDITGLSADPEFVKIFRWNRAIPQYNVGHAARLDAIEEIVGRHPGLVLTGNAFRGVSLNDCIVNAWKTAEAVVPGQAGDKGA